MAKEFDIAVVIGRFQFGHIMHAKLFEKAQELSDNPIVIIGSQDESRTVKNPLSVEERSAAIYFDTGILTIGVPDFPLNDEDWVSYVHTAVAHYANWAIYGASLGELKVALVGHKKDASSFYLDLFPDWTFVPVEAEQEISSTDIRAAIFEDRFTDVEHLITPGFKLIYEEIKGTAMFAQLKYEHEYLKEYPKKYGKGPFPTADNLLVTDTSKVVLIKRGGDYGKGLWAMPGGFKDHTDPDLVFAAARELSEELELDASKLQIVKHAIAQYSHKNRSLRAEEMPTVVVPYLISESELDLAKAGDDAEDYALYDIEELHQLRPFMFEDHYSLIMDRIEHLYKLGVISGN